MFCLRTNNSEKSGRRTRKSLEAEGRGWAVVVWDWQLADLSSVNIEGGVASRSMSRLEDDREEESL